MIKYSMAKKKPSKTIHKKNEVVRGLDDYSLAGRRAMNAVYYAVQRNELYKHNKFRIKMTTMRELMVLEKDNRYIEIIKDSIKELQRPIELNNYHHPIEGKKYQWYSTVFLSEAGFTKEDGEWIITVIVSPLILHLMQTSGNFTKLDLFKYTQRLRTRHAFKIYEYLRSFKAYRYIEISHDHLIKMLNIGEGKQEYKYYSAMHRMLERTIKELKKKTDLDTLELIKSKHLAKERTYRIIIDPKANEILKAKALREKAQKLANAKRVKKEDVKPSLFDIDAINKHDDLIEKISRGELL